MSTLRIGSLFSGYGGLDMGVQSVLGGDLAWYSEIDKGALKVLRHHHPDVPNLSDITTVDWSQVEPVDILTGGSPCQDLSHAGKRGGMSEGNRSNLWVSMREAIAELRPALVVWENVRGAYSAAADSDVEPCQGCVGNRPGEPALRALGRVLGDLSDLGYDAGWHGLRAADVGACHGRFRVFVVAHTRGVGWVGWPGGERDGRASAFGGQAVGDPLNGSPPLLPTPRTSDTNGAGAHGDGGVDLRTAVALLPTPRATDGTKGGPNQRGSSGDLMLPSAVTLLPTPAVNDTDWGIYADAIEGWVTVLGRSAPTPTMLSKKGTPQLNPELSEFMMGLAAGYVTGVPGITRNEALKALGNGCVPQQVAAAARYLLSVEVAA